MSKCELSLTRVIYARDSFPRIVVMEIRQFNFVRQQTHRTTLRLWFVVALLARASAKVYSLIHYKICKTNNAVS